MINFRVDSCFVIKVADFGLSENMDTSKEYFRQNEDSTTKLPLRWLALESITDRKFSEKTDVVWKLLHQYMLCYTYVPFISNS